MVPDETSDLPTTLPEASFLNPNRKVPSEARSLRGLFPVPVFAEFPSYSLSKNADGFLQNPFWLSYCNLRKLKVLGLMKISSQKLAQTIVMITHNDEIAQMADRIIRLEDGKIVRGGE